MTNEQILQKAIEKAVKNGIGEDWKYLTKEYYQLIFSHDFAKAFFKDKDMHWKHHLMMMAREEEPLKYIEMFL